MINEAEVQAYLEQIENSGGIVLGLESIRELMDHCKITSVLYKTIVAQSELLQAAPLLQHQASYIL